MSEEFDLCGYCCEWTHAMEGKSPATVRDAYPGMMRRVLKEMLGMPKSAAKDFVAEACAGNWERLHETKVEMRASAADYADMLICDVAYCSDRWSWDRAIRIQWLYQRLIEHIGKETVWGE